MDPSQPLSTNSTSTNKWAPATINYKALELKLKFLGIVIPSIWVVSGCSYLYILNNQLPVPSTSPLSYALDATYYLALIVGLFC